MAKKSSKNVVFFILFDKILSYEGIFINLWGRPNLTRILNFFEKSEKFQVSVIFANFTGSIHHPKKRKTLARNPEPQGFGLARTV